MLTQLVVGSASVAGLSLKFSDTNGAAELSCARPAITSPTAPVSWKESGIVIVCPPGNMTAGCGIHQQYEVANGLRPDKCEIYPLNRPKNPIHLLASQRHPPPKALAATD